MTTSGKTSPETGEPASGEPLPIANTPGGVTRSEAPTEPGPGEPPQETTRPALSDTRAPDVQAIHNQDTVVSPRLRQFATTPSQPLRPPAGVSPRPPVSNQPASGPSTRLYMLVGVIAVLVLLALILVAVILARSGPSLLAGLNPTKTPVATRRSLLAPTSAFPPTFTPAPVLATPTPQPPTITPRPAPTALEKDVLAKVTPPEGVKLKVRQSASLTGPILGELDVNAEVAIVDGPTDANGITWWQVDNGKGLVGWSAEGAGGVKYLIPVGWAK